MKHQFGVTIGNGAVNVWRFIRFHIMFQRPITSYKLF
jgi:hypothetical protein